mgnify:CR=1 FL=1
MGGGRNRHFGAVPLFLPDAALSSVPPGTDATLLHNQMAVYAQTTSGKDYAKMQEDGFSPMDMEAHTIVTVTDRITKVVVRR